MKTYYHITTKDWGNEVVLQPRVPRRGTDAGEPKFPRICVCPSIIGCMVATGYDEFCLGFNVYITQEKTIPSRGVFDSKITGERWITDAAKFKFAGVVKVVGKLNYKDIIPEKVSIKLPKHLQTARDKYVCAHIDKLEAELLRKNIEKFWNKKFIFDLEGKRFAI